MAASVAGPAEPPAVDPADVDRQEILPAARPSQQSGWKFRARSLLEQTGEGKRCLFPGQLTVRTKAQDCGSSLILQRDVYWKLHLQREDLALLGQAPPDLGAPRGCPLLALPDMKISIVACISPEN